MSEAKFTKGVWSAGRKGSVVSTESNGITINGAVGEDAVSCYGGNLICESVSENNAHLIAAAPDMYRLLERLTDHSNSTKCIVHLLGEADSLIERINGGNK